MSDIFPQEILKLPEVDIPFYSVKGYLSQGKNHQIVFMEFTEDTDIPEHSHKSQWELVINGKVDLNIGGKTKTYSQGDSFYIQENQPHSGHVYRGYAAIAFFNESSRYSVKK